MIIEKKDYLKLKIFEKIPYKIKSNDLLTKLVIIRAAELAFINLSKKKKLEDRYIHP